MLKEQRAEQTQLWNLKRVLYVTNLIWRASLLLYQFWRTEQESAKGEMG